MIKISLIILLIVITGILCRISYAFGKMQGYHDGLTKAFKDQGRK